MAKAAVFISDIHLGTIGKLQDFDSYNEFDRFLNDKLISEFPSDDLDLILLGDILDLWQAVPENDLPQIVNSKLVPTHATIQLELNQASEQQKIRDIVQNNESFFQSVARLLKDKPNRRLYFIPGNHDHSLVDGVVQQELTTLMEGFGIDKQQLVIGQLFYENPSLQVYAEHGNQFDSENSYANFQGFSQGGATYQGECKGYFFVRLFWNLLKSLDPSIGSGPSRWYKFFAWLAQNKRLRLISPAAALFRGYKNHPQPFARISGFERIINNILSVEEQGGQREMLLMFPENLFKDEFDPDAVFSYDPNVEEFYRKLYFNPGEDGTAWQDIVDEILSKKAEKLPTPWQVPPPRDASQSLENELQKVNYTEDVSISSDDLIPGAARAILGVQRDKHENAAQRLLAPGNRSSLKGTPIDPQIRYIVFGHTHRPQQKSLSDGRMYFNTGTWQTWKDEQGTSRKDLTYVLIHNKGQEGHVDGRLYHYVTY